MTAANLSIIVDNPGPHSIISGPNTTVLPYSDVNMQAEYYGGTNFELEGPGAFRSYFIGMSIAFIGIIPSSPSQAPTVTIDETVFSINNEAPKSTYGQWFQSPQLVDGFHTITVNCSNGTMVDFSIINVGTQTDISSQTSIVDNDSPYISYSGHWSRDTSEFAFTTYLSGYPYGNSTHRSSTPGDTFTFRFTGTSVFVYGIFSWVNLGVLTVTYTLDGATIPQTRNVTSRNLANGDHPNFLHYSVENLPAGDHTLIVNVTVADNQVFVLDYITYTPSFETLSSMPLLSNTTSTTLGSDPSSQPSQSQTSGTPQPSPTVAILGGVIGLLGLVVVAILGRWFLQQRKQRKAKQTEDISQYLYQPDSDAHVQNLNGMRQVQVRPQRYPQPVKNRRPNSAGMQAIDFHLPDSPSNVDSPVAEVVADLPPYNNPLSQ